jgi:hypothetical protein
LRGPKNARRISPSGVSQKLLQLIENSSLNLLILQIGNACGSTGAIVTKGCYLQQRQERSTGNRVDSFDSKGDPS